MGINQAERSSGVIQQLHLGNVNSFLIGGENTMLVDTGSGHRSIKKLIKALAKLKCTIQDVKYLFITHAHWDHCGNAAALKQQHPNLQVIMQKEDASFAVQGRNAQAVGLGWAGKNLAAIVGRSYPAFRPDIVFNDVLALDDLGIKGVAMHTPGHTAGSASIVLENGAAIVGDMIMGNPLLQHQPAYHLFVSDFDLNNQSLQRVIASNASTFFVGHGGPLTLERVFLKLGKRCFYH